MLGRIVGTAIVAKLRHRSSNYSIPSYSISSDHANAVLHAKSHVVKIDMLLSEHLQILCIIVRKHSCALLSVFLSELTLLLGDEKPISLLKRDSMPVKYPLSAS